MSRLPRFIVVFIIPLVVIAMGIGAAAMLFASREEPQRKERTDRGTLVETIPVEQVERSIEVEAKGTVTAARRVVVQPQVSGRITWINEDLVPGGLIEEGEPLFRVDPRDYRLAVEQRKTSVDQAEAQLRIEEGQQRVAKKEWELFKDQVEGDDDPSLALRQPQQRVAEVAVEAAKSQLEKAKLDLSRTTVRAPFNLMVQSESVEAGQFVGPNSQAATVVGTDHFWVQTSIPMDRLEYVTVPGVNGDEGSAVTVIQQVGARSIERRGRVVRLLGELDTAGRMARVLVEIDDPLNLTAKEDGEKRGLPVLLGSYVTVRFDGAQAIRVVEIPRTSLHEGDKAWVFDDGTLAIRPVGVVWRRDATVYVSSGLKEGDELITSRIPTPLPGMKLRRAKGKDPLSAPVDEPETTAEEKAAEPEEVAQ
jgi:RND family efflux transporter MFP subunit